MKMTDSIFLVGTHVYRKDKSVKFILKGAFKDFSKAMALTAYMPEWTIMKVLVPHEIDF